MISGIAAAIVFAVAATFAVQRTTPFIFDDEFGFLGMGAAFAGLDWSAAAAGIPYYAFGYSLLVSPFYLLGFDPVGLYKLALLLNSLLLGCTCLVLVRLGKRIFGDVSRVDVCLAAIAACLYPAAVLYSNFAWAESLLLLVFVLTAYAIDWARREPEKKTPYLLIGILVGSSWLVHSRGLVFAIAGILSIVPLVLNHRVKPRQWVVLVLAAVVTAFVGVMVKSWLMTAFYAGEMKAGQESVAAFGGRRFDRLLSDGGISGFLHTLIGQSAYLLTSTLGLMLIGTIEGARRAGVFSSGYLAKRRGSNGSPTILGGRVKGIDPTMLFILLGFLGMLLLSVLATFSGKRADHMVYGRYVEVTIPPLLFIAFLQLRFGMSARWKRIGGLFLAVLFALATLALLSIVKGDQFEKPTELLSVTGWFVYRSTQWKISPLHIGIGTIVSATIALLALAVHYRVFVLWLIAFWVSVTVTNFQQHIAPGDNAWTDVRLAGEKYSGSIGSERIAFVASNWRTNLLREGLQFHFPAAEILPTEDCAMVPKTGAAYLVLAGKQNVCDGFELLETFDRFSLYRHQQDSRPDKEQLASNSDERTTRTRIRFVIAEHAEPLVVGGFVHRVADFLKNYQATAWAKFLMDDVRARVEVQAVGAAAGNEKIGAFLTDAQGHWHMEWRLPLPDAMEEGGVYEIDVPIVLSNRGHFQLEPGNYHLHLALVNESGWQWNSVAKQKLVVK